MEISSVETYRATFSVKNKLWLFRRNKDARHVNLEAYCLQLFVILSWLDYASTSEKKYSTLTAHLFDIQKIPRDTLKLSSVHVYGVGIGENLTVVGY